MVAMVILACDRCRAQVVGTQVCWLIIRDCQGSVRFVID